MNNSEYTPRPIDTSDVVLPDELVELAEQISRNVHEVWSAGRISQGWKLGPVRNDEKLEHPCLTHYDNLSEEEKDFDRNTSMETLKLILKLGFRILPPEK